MSFIYVENDKLFVRWKQGAFCETNLTTLALSETQQAILFKHSAFICLFSSTRYASKTEGDNLLPLNTDRLHSSTFRCD